MQCNDEVSRGGDWLGVELLACVQGVKKSHDYLLYCWLPYYCGKSYLFLPQLLWTSVVIPPLSLTLAFCLPCALCLMQCIIPHFSYAQFSYHVMYIIHSFIACLPS